MTTKKQRKLPVEVIRLLGTMSDDDLAKSCGRPRSTIRSARLGRGIEASIKKQGLEKEIVLLLGTMPDCRLADLAACNESTIRSARTRRGIDKFVKSSNTGPRKHSDTPTSTKIARLSEGRSDVLARLVAIKLNPEIDPKLIECLGTMEDADAGDKFGMSRRAVCSLRNRLGIRAFDPTTENALLIELLGTQKDESLAREFGKSPQAVARLRTKFGIARYVLENDSEILKVLGKMTDVDVARRFGCTTVSVATLRAKHNIGRYVAPCKNDGLQAQATD